MANPNSILLNRYSYSGSDAKVYAYYNRTGKRAHLESMHTISWSVFEAKGRVRSLGFKSIRGFTRAVREISGTLIMTIIEDHPLAPLMVINPNQKSNLYGGGAATSWSLDAAETMKGSANYESPLGGKSPSYVRVPTTLPPFNIMVLYNTEAPDSITNTLQNIARDPKSKEAVFSSMRTAHDSTACVEIVDIEIMGQGMVSSVNDMVTEVQYQFCARDIREFNKIPEQFISEQYRYVERFSMGDKAWADLISELPSNAQVSRDGKTVVMTSTYSDANIESQKKILKKCFLPMQILLQL